MFIFHAVGNPGSRVWSSDHDEMGYFSTKARAIEAIRAYAKAHDLNEPVMDTDTERHFRSEDASGAPYSFAIAYIEVDSEW